MRTRSVAVFVAACALYSTALSSETNVTAIDVKRIVPVLKGAAHAQERAGTSEAPRQGISRPDFYFEPLNRQLYIYYAVDTERSVRYLSREEIRALGFSPGELSTRAVDNLTHLLPGIERRGDAGIYVVSAGGTYEASLLLFDAIWTKENFEVKGDIVVAVPSRELLLVTGSEDENGLKKLRKLAEAAVGQERHALTARLFVRKDGGWLPLRDRNDPP